MGGGDGGGKRSQSPKVQESQGPRVKRSKRPKDQDILKSHSNSSLTLKKVHLVTNPNDPRILILNSSVLHHLKYL